MDIYDATDNELYIVKEGLTYKDFILKTRCGSIERKNNLYIYNPGIACENPWILVYNKKMKLIDSIPIQIIPMPVGILIGGLPPSGRALKYGQVYVNSVENRKLEFVVKEFTLSLYRNETLVFKERIIGNNIYTDSFNEIYEYDDIIQIDDVLLEEHPYSIQEIHSARYTRGKYNYD